MKHTPTPATQAILDAYNSGESARGIAKRMRRKKNSIVTLIRSHGLMRTPPSKLIEHEVAAWASRFASSCRLMPGDAPFDMLLDGSRIDVKSAHLNARFSGYYFAVGHKESLKDPAKHIDWYYLVFLDLSGRPVYRMPQHEIKVKRTIHIPVTLKTKYTLELLGHLDDAFGTGGGYHVSN